jgi:hypothetical protein
MQGYSAVDQYNEHLAYCVLRLYSGPLCFCLVAEFAKELGLREAGARRWTEGKSHGPWIDLDAPAADAGPEYESSSDVR